MRVCSLFNDEQKKIILHASSVVLKSPETPQIVLIQGPPGTGKTRLITGIIQQLLYGKSETQPFRLLVVAPSNAAVDEIGCRLISLRYDCKGLKIRAPNFVRIGQPHMMHVNVKPYFLDSLLSRYIQGHEVKRNSTTETIEKLKEKVKISTRDLAGLRTSRLVSPEILRMKQEEIRVLQQHISEQECILQGLLQTLQNKRSIKSNYMKNADIILSTLNSCRQAITQSLNFTCCIVDEATQCSEPELLSPILAFDIRKLILVGDPQQLPATVKSVEASENGYSLSMFERMFHNVKHTQNKVMMLTGQYRMPKEICSFPSREFYGNSLVTKCVKKFFPIKPYTLFDLKDGQESCDPSSSSISNNREANFVAQLCVELLKVVSEKHSIGIITPYRDQVKQIESKLGNHSNIEVNTVDGFQGREKDIIVISCVRSNNTGYIGFLNNRQRLNVALTRASNSLIICGNLQSLTAKDYTWQKLIADANSRKLVHTTSTFTPVNNLVRNVLLNQ